MSTILFFALLAPACSVYRSSSGLFDLKSLQEVKIIDSGRLYSTYDFDKYEREELRQQLTPEQLELVEKYHKEDAWPPAISTFEKREEVRPLISGYRAFIVAQLDDKYVLIIPARLNKKMPSGMRPDRDIFFVISKSAVSMIGTEVGKK